MPHIHTGPGQHDITASAWIFMERDGMWRVLVHMHRRFSKLMQVGGHVEIDETPWQTLAHELVEEAGYSLSDLKILQPLQERLTMTGVTSHPVPVVSNTHLVNDEHYHSDYGYAFVAQAKPTQAPADGESMDLRWLTIAELQAGVEKGDVLTDVMEIYAYIAEKIVPRYYQIDAVSYSVDKPSVSLLQGK